MRIAWGMRREDDCAEMVINSETLEGQKKGCKKGLTAFADSYCRGIPRRSHPNRNFLDNEDKNPYEIIGRRRI